MYFVLLNGPPRCGKDTAALAICNYFIKTMSVRWEKFSFPNKYAFAGMMQAQIDRFGNVEYYEEHKEEIVPALGVSYRQWQIDYSENYMKPLYGRNVFGRLLLDRCKARLNEPNWLCPIGDCGFQVEVDTLAKSYQSDKCLLITIRRVDCTFVGDSREWVWPTDNMAHITICNDKTKEAFEEAVVNEVSRWLDAQKCNA